MERQHGALERRHRFGRRHVGEHHAQPLDGAGVELRHARFVDADLRADLLHRDVAVVVEGDDFLLARRQRGDGAAHRVLHLAALVGRIGRFRLRRHQRRRQTGLVDGLAGRQRRRGFDRVDADDGAAEPLFVGANLARRGRPATARGRARGAASSRAASSSRRDAADAARPGVAAKRVDHRAADRGARRRSRT